MPDRASTPSLTGSYERDPQASVQAIRRERRRRLKLTVALVVGVAIVVGAMILNYSYGR